MVVSLPHHIGLRSFRTKYYAIDPIFIGWSHSPSGRYLSAHKHQFNEIHLVRRGEIDVRIGKQRSTVPAGSIFYIAAGDSHSQYFRKSSDVYYFAFCISFFHDPEEKSREGIIRKDASELNPYSFSQSGIFTPSASACELLPRFIGVHSTRPYHRTIEDSELLWDLLIETSQNLRVIRRSTLSPHTTTPSKATTDDFPGIQKALSYIHEHFTEPLEVAHLARDVHMSCRHFTRLFVRLLGISPKQYINELRFHKALQLLDDMSVKASIIGERIGFKKPAYFFSFFKKFAHQTPEQYRAGKRHPGNIPSPRLAP